MTSAPFGRSAAILRRIIGWVDGVVDQLPDRLFASLLAGSMTHHDALGAAADRGAKNSACAHLRD
jgi:hypothetical protein